MPGYRICSLDADGLIRHIRSEAFESDDAAMAVAFDLAERFAAVEVWNSGRLIRSLRGAAGPSDGSGQGGKERDRQPSSQQLKDTVDAEHVITRPARAEAASVKRLYERWCLHPAEIASALGFAMTGGWPPRNGGRLRASQ